MDNFNKLKSIIQSKKNAITNVFVDSETNNKSISDFAIDHHTINKDSYTLNLFTYEKSIPEKKKDAVWHLSFSLLFTALCGRRRPPRGGSAPCRWRRS